MESREVIPIKQSFDHRLALPGSKSIANRALLCASLAQGKSRIFGIPDSEDVNIMLRALGRLGVKYKRINDYRLAINDSLEIHGLAGRLKSGKMKFDLGNSGTAVRFLTAIMAVRDGESVITGDKRMKERPIADLVDGLKQLGVEVEYLGKEGYPPLLIKSPKVQKSKKPNFVIKIKGDKSSQFISAMLMLGPLLPAPLRIEVIGELVSKPYIDTTISVMKSFGVKVKNDDYKSFTVKPQKYRATEYWIEGDATAASYWSAIAYLHGGKVRFENLSGKSIQGDANFSSVLYGQMSNVKGQRLIDMSDMPDAAMTMACVAPFVKGETKITGLSTLRLKETDRIAALEKELGKIGVGVRIGEDSITIQGLRTKDYGLGRDTVDIKTYNDHRMAMCFAVIGTLIQGIAIETPKCVGKTYPRFWDDLEKLYLSSKIRLGKKNLVLTGMRGAGKTFYGKKIATLLKRKFVDLDLEIEKSEGMSISEIVREHGWEYFRKVEQKICSSFDSALRQAQGYTQDDKFSGPLVIATGGGVVLNPDNMKALKKNGVNVFIFADTNVLEERIKKSGRRPALKLDNPITEIQTVWNERRGLYLKYADFVWDDTGGKVIVERLKMIFD